MRKPVRRFFCVQRGIVKRGGHVDVWESSIFRWADLSPAHQAIRSLHSVQILPQVLSRLMACTSDTSMPGSWMPASRRRAPCAPMRTDTRGQSSPGCFAFRSDKNAPPAVPAGQMRAKQGHEAVVLTLRFWKAAHRPRHRESRRLWQKNIRARRLLWPCRFFA